MMVNPYVMVYNPDHPDFFLQNNIWDHLDSEAPSSYIPRPWLCPAMKKGLQLWLF
jgi:hypothetical protein